MTARRRFYKDVTVTDDFAIALDGRLVKTPLKQPLRLPNRAAADLVAQEWAAQGETIDPPAMIFTKLANTAIDRVAGERHRIIAEILDYAGSDLVCYRAEAPESLVQRQSARWTPVIDWARTALDAPFETRPGLVHRAQPPAALAAVERALASLNPFELAAFFTIMTLTGSALLALMLAHGAIEPDAAWVAAHIDEDFQIENWGEDSEAAARRAARHAEYLACCRFLELARP